MSTPPIPPRPRPATDPRNRALSEHEVQRQGTTLEQLRVRQSNHEFEVKETFDAVGRRDEELVGMVREVGAAIVVVAREMGIDHRLPPLLRARHSLPPPPPGSKPPPRPPPVLPEIQRDSRLGRRGIYLALALSVSELALELLRHLGGF